MPSGSRYRAFLFVTLWAGFLVPVSLVATPPGDGPLGEEASLSEGGGVKVFSPAATFTSDGGLLVVWESQLGGILSRRLDRDGHPSAAPIPLAPNHLPGLDELPYKGPGTSRVSPAVVALPGGGFAVAWTEEGLHLDVWVYKEKRQVETSRIFAQRFDAAGKPAGEPVAVGGGTGLETAPALVRLSGGDLLAVWELRGPAKMNAKEKDGPADGIWARALSPRLEPRGEPFRVDDLDGKAGSGPGVAAGASGGFLVTWESCCDAGGDGGIFARVFEAPGKPAAASFPVNATTAGEQSLPVVAASGAGYLVAWLGPANGPAGAARELQVFGRSIGADGAPSGGDWALSGGVGRQPTRPGLAAGAGGYLVAWCTGPGPRKGVFVRRVDAAGEPAGEAVQVSKLPTNYERRIALAGDGAHRYGAAWGGFNAADHPSINARVLAQEAPAPPEAAPGDGHR